MGFLDSMFDNVLAKGVLMKYGIKRPDDAYRFVSRIIEQFDPDDEDIQAVKEIRTWLKREAASGSFASEAEYALKRLKMDYHYKDFCNRYHL